MNYIARHAIIDPRDPRTVYQAGQVVPADFPQLADLIANGGVRCEPAAADQPTIQTKPAPSPVRKVPGWPRAGDR